MNTAVTASEVPQHIAIIMDGNGRWAQSRGLPRVVGHRAGAGAIRPVLERAEQLGVKVLTLYSFSSENWNRPTAEVDALMALCCEKLAQARASLLESGIRLRRIGSRAGLPAEVLRELDLTEAATAGGVFHESANFASLHKLPVVFVCENNLYSVYSPMEVRQPAHREVFEQARGHGMVAHQGDGNDPLVVHRLMTDALAHARARRGPVFLELKTYRWREHCGPSFDNHIGYRTEAEYLAWKERDPIATFELRLRAAGIFDQQRHDRFVQQQAVEIASAFTAAKSAPFPASSTLMDHVYA